jgi:hypothetical protein
MIYKKKLIYYNKLMIEKMMFIRLLTTLILFLTQNNLPLTAIALLLLDAVDSNFRIQNNRLIFTTTPISKEYDTNTYQKYDKVIDLYQYLFALSLVYDKIPNGWNDYIVYALVWRMIGVSLFLITDNRKIIVPFVDIIKEILFLSIFIQPTLTNLTYIILLKILLVEIPIHLFGISFANLFK